MYFLWFSYCDASWSVEYEAIDLMQHALNQWLSAGFALDINKTNHFTKWRMHLQFKCFDWMHLFKLICLFILLS